jgi:23S rRNA (adenine2503-C2)-methyltransferase
MICHDSSCYYELYIWISYTVRKITISTCGFYESIQRFIDEKMPYNLAISLNDTDMVKRSRYMPVEKKYPMQNIIRLLDVKFPASRNRVTIEYVMRKDNISEEDAQRLKSMFKYNRIKLNLIPLNKGKHNMEIPVEEEINKFIKRLEIMNIPISIRKSAGSV